MPVNHQINTVQSIQLREEHWETPEIPDTGTQHRTITWWLRDKKQRPAGRIEGQHFMCPLFIKHKNQGLFFHVDIFISESTCFNVHNTYYFSSHCSTWCQVSILSRKHSEPPRSLSHSLSNEHILHQLSKP